MTNELLPCPFCGQEVAIEEETVLMYERLNGYRINHNCTSALYTSVYMASRGITDNDREELIAAWNTRVRTDSCDGCVHNTSRYLYEGECSTCTRAWGDKYEVAQ